MCSASLFGAYIFTKVRVRNLYITVLFGDISVRCKFVLSCFVTVRTLYDLNQ